MDTVVESSDESADVRAFDSLRAEKAMETQMNPCSQQAFTFLTVCSLLIINEGGVRLISMNPAAGISGGRPPNILLFLGGLFELIIGLLGFFIGMNGFVGRALSVRVTKMSPGLQAILGSFVNLVYVFIIPAIRSIDLEKHDIQPLNLGEGRFLIALGILTSFHFSFALLGAQFVLLTRLVALKTNQNFLGQKRGARCFALVWNANLGLAGTWTVLTGIYIRINVGPGILDEPFQFPPNTGRFPGLTVVTGLSLLLLALTGSIVILTRAPLPKFYLPAVLFVYLLGLLNYSVIQPGFIRSAPSSDVALNAGSVFMLVFFGLYFTHLAAKMDEDQR